MIAWIGKQLDKLRTGNQLTQWGNGRWYVRYVTGERSTTMHYGTACTYASIFGGKVRHITQP